MADVAYTISLVFGGCCSNALTLEEITKHYSGVGTLLTFSQFLVVALVALPSHLTFSGGPEPTGLSRLPYPRLKPRQLPLLPYLAQVALYYGISRLNNAAFAYEIPMTVHIIFRSGGLVVSMLLGWILLGRRYNIIQAGSVLLVSAGVMISTLSASPKSQASTDRVATLTTSYLHGIGILSIALVLGGLIGIVQDRTFAAHRQRVAALSSKDSHSTTAGKVETPWKEAMFYLHFLSLPLFVPSLPSLRAQFIALSSSPLRHAPSIPLTGPVQTLLSPFLSKTANPYIHLASGGIDIAMPTALISLCANVATQLVCSSGVNRLTSQVSSLTVTLILVVRKAASLILSVYLNGGSGGTQLWVGAALVLLGTVGYTLGSAKPKGKVKEE